MSSIVNGSDEQWILDRLRERWSLGSLALLSRVEPPAAFQEAFYRLGHVDGQIEAFCAQNAIDTADVTEVAHRIGIEWTASGGVLGTPS